MNRLELDVGERNLYQRRKAIIAMEECLPFAQRVVHGVRRWRDKDRVREPAAARANPVLTRP